MWWSWEAVIVSVFTAEQEVLELLYLEDDEYTAVANL